MEKILLALDPTQAGSQAFDFACYLGVLTNSKVTGVFLGSPEAGEKLVLHDSLYDTANSSFKQDSGREEFHEKKETIMKYVLSFTEACDRRGVRHSVHIASGEPVKEIVHQSRYADLLVLDPGISFGKRFEGMPSSFVKEILREAECPVVIAPESFEDIEEIVFTYDGSKSAMFAIKQFCYLFPKLDDKKVILLQVDNGVHCLAEDSQHLKEWVSSHYSSIGFQTLQGDSKTELLTLLLQKKNAFIVMGAYSRNALSQFFHSSHADILIQTLNRAFFVAHC